MVNEPLLPGFILTECSDTDFLYENELNNENVYSSNEIAFKILSKLLRVMVNKPLLLSLNVYSAFIIKINH